MMTPKEKVLEILTDGGVNLQGCSTTAKEEDFRIEELQRLMKELVFSQLLFLSMT